MVTYSQLIDVNLTETLIYYQSSLILFSRKVEVKKGLMLNFQEMIAALTHYWANQGCAIHQGYDLEVGAGTFNPATFLRCQGPEPYAAVYVEPSRRPKDGRYGENPNRLQFYHQMQVIIKPSPPNLQDLYLESLKAIGLDVNQHDIRFVHDDWENPTIGAWGLGWEVWLDGMEVTQFTYFQAVGGIPVSPVSGEITYGLERLAMYLQDVNSFFELKWNDTLLYGDLYKKSEWEWSHYNFKEANTAMWFAHFDDFEKEAKRLVGLNLPIPAYDFVIKASHAFNILDARGVISVTERTGYINRIRSLAKLLSHAYLKSREAQNFPLLRPTATPAVETPQPLSFQHFEEKDDFLLEIGSEELPATFVPIGINNLEKGMRGLLKDHQLPFEEIHAYGTPRRLAVVVKGLAKEVPSQIVEKKGPALTAAFDAKGSPTKVGEGFFRSHGFDALSLTQVKEGNLSIEIRALNGVDYLFVNKKTESKPAVEILAPLLSSLVLNIDFPKKMRWGALDIEYARPIRWLVSLYGAQEIPFVVGNIKSGKITYGHRQLSPERIPLSHANKYLDTLRHHFVMADQEEREKSILTQIQTFEKKLHGKVALLEKVLPQVLHLVEWPFLTEADFDPLYLKAPKEVLISEMVEHQKYLPLIDATGALMPLFLIVCNNKPTALIRAGNQKAVTPRLADGLFLYEEDLKTPLADFAKKLRTITFQKDLGSVAEKGRRLMANVEILHRFLPIAELPTAKRAAFLAKADLASELVGEFPDLQGIIGKIYALKSGEEAAVAEAIDEHWMPRGEKAPLPHTPCGILVSLAEKIDNLLSCFLLGMIPSSSSDPYALRRQAIAIIKILISKHYHLPLQQVLKEAAGRFLENPELTEEKRKAFTARQEEAICEINAFIENRMRFAFIEEGFEKDEIEAVLAKRVDDIFETYHLLRALHTFRKEEKGFGALLEVYTRAKKILVNQLLSAPLDPHFLQESTEKVLAKKIESVESALSSKHTYQEAFSQLVELREPLDAFFSAVKVLDDHPPLRANRLALLKKVQDLCETVVDFSKIQEIK